MTFACSAQVPGRLFSQKHMANFELEGTLSSKLAPQTGRSARGEWAKQEFTVEFQDGNFPSTAVFSVWGQDKVSDLAKYNVGDRGKVSFGISSREYNGRWYTDLRAWRIAPQGQQAAQGYAPAVPDIPSAPAPSASDIPADDLPF